MEKPQHTPGPWVLSITGNPMVYAADPIIGPLVASVHDGRNGFGSKESKETSRANATLIIAAPDMLAALEEIIDAAEYRGFHPEFLINAHAAVKKARGQA